MRRRLITTMVLLVAVTTIAIGFVVWAVVAGSLRSQIESAASQRIEFAAAVLSPARLPDDVTIDGFVDLQFASDLQLSADEGLYVEFGVGEPFVSGFRFSTGPSTALATAVGGGRLAWEWTDIAGQGYLVAGARTPETGPSFYLFVPTDELDSTLAALRLAVGIAGTVVVVGAASVAARVARRVLRPVSEASIAAGAIATGDLATRLDDSQEDEFGQWAGAFNRMAASLEATIDKLKEAEALQRHFVADVAHELRTPLTGLVNEAELLRRRLDDFPPDVRRVAELVIRDVGRMRRLVEDLLEVSRLDAASDPVASDVVHLGRLIRSNVADRLSGATVHVEDVAFTCDRRRLDRIVGNLLANASVHAGGENIDVTASVDEGELIVEVADRGPGFDGDLDWLFGRFSQADQSRSGEGTGLGLAIARDHTRALGGELTAAHRPGGGLVFRLEVPVTQLLPDGEGVVTS